MREAEPRFWIKARIGDGCWEWQGSRSTQGYGRFGVRGRNRQAHRVAYELWHGVSPGELFVCHHCDNTRCIRPSHLFIGTQKDNVRDMIEKGRFPDTHGERNPRAKLAMDDVALARRLYAAGGSSYSVLANRFGVSVTGIRYAINGTNWGEVSH
jgi:hypothetical protein